MALYHKTTITPSKSEILAGWVPQQRWCPEGTSEIDVIGAFRFDDPAGKVGIESHLVRAGDTVLHVPLTYREQPLADGEHALVSTMEHGALGTRWIYDGVLDPRYLAMVAAVAMTGQGEALGMVEVDGRWWIAPSPVRIEGGGWTGARVAVDEMVTEDAGAETVQFSNERFDLAIHRRPAERSRPPMGLTARWEGQNPLVVAEVNERS